MGGDCWKPRITGAESKIVENIHPRKATHKIFPENEDKKLSEIGAGADRSKAR